MTAVSYYDLLDVDPSASREEIRAAWQRAVADLDPTDRRFRAYNRAAEVLLDPDRRGEYDASLPDEHDEPRDLEESRDREEPVEPGPLGEPGGHASGAGAGAEPEPDAAEPRRSPPGRLAGLTRTWVLAGLAVTLVLLAGLATYLAAAVPTAEETEQVTRDAQAAAEDAITSVLAFDAESLDASREEAHEHLTASYRREYDKFFDGVVATNAPGLGTRIEVQVLASGIVRSGEDRAQVLLFVNRPTTSSGDAEPVVYRDQVTVTMEQVDGRWLVDGLDTQPLK